MKGTMKVGKWYEKLSQKEREHFARSVERYDVNKLRSFYTAARKKFASKTGAYSDDKYTFEPCLCVVHDNVLWGFSYERKEFVCIGQHS
mgnify:CR=1 FL=1